MENSLAPAFVKINYTSVYAPHTMTLPTVPLIAAVGDAPPYFDLRGAEIDVNADTAIRDFLAILKAFFRSTTTFNDYTLYTQDGAGGTPTPVWSAALGIVGTNPAGAVPDKAVQRTWSFRADDFGLFKLVLLDVPEEANFARGTVIGAGTPQEDLRDYIVAPETWLAARSGGRPNTFLQWSTTLNEKLRRSYRMN